MLKLRLRRAPREDAAPLLVPVVEGDAARFPFAAAAGFTGAAGQVAEQPGPARRLILLGCGTPKRSLDWEEAGGLGLAAAGAVPRLGLDARGLAPEAAASLAAGAALRAWRCDAYRAPGEVAPSRLDLIVDSPEAVLPRWARAEAAVRGCLLARELVAMPANRLTTREFARRLETLAEHGITVDVLGRKRLRREGLGGLLAVGGGSANPPRLAVLRWRGSVAAPPVAFIGKGLCFDTGGISIKPASGMQEMKADMAGAAACAGAMLALALRRSPAPAVAVLAIAENMTGAASYRPGDVLRMGSGRTVEVVDTDAEGRLVLADALHYAATQFRPQAMLDLATLTGAIVTALGAHRAGLFGTDAALLAQAAAAGEMVGERLWPMPIGTRHREDLRSDIADLKQCATGRFLPDACHAAAFLREFAGGVPWAHLDIAGVDTRAEAGALGGKGPSGFGARLLDMLMQMYFEDVERH
ncbi:leucyl aminopeptidase family protein [Siccirubricoccus sp. KC 17139]|uniref:Leucyl aminopeptidase family protein n=1 Tax=Siccirubricoccus soli TaxID=2899147 RepID=A0ABT1DBL5_9PROT|nr:leucyl aminopeptidase family protein [Siccirubricoccus soli]MCO6418600.1 leucyl aminopeptidase family protein [Siccirubricoccus soli]MCP2684735.1 leucyl aminopeptidase family protein [Siccirubricoccus soli]